MRKIILEKTFLVDINRVWDKISDIAHYPEFIKFMQHVEVPEGIGEGKTWYDTTTICWIPLRLPHKIVKFEVNKELQYDLVLPLGGRQSQHITLMQNDKGTLIVFEVNSSFGNFLVDILIGGIVERRIRTMMVESAKKLEEQLME